MCPSTSTVHALLHPPQSTVKGQNSTGIPDAMINGVKDVWVQKSTLRIPLHVQFYSCCTINMGFKKN
jgi:hypothetical protein